MKSKIREFLNQKHTIMSKSILLSFGTALLLAGTAFASTVPVQQAEQVARNIYAERFKAQNNMEPNSIEFSAVITQRDRNNVPLIYIFNVSNAKGFVMIAAQDNVHPILAYTFEGNFDADFYHPEFTSWTNTYKEQISYCIEKNAAPDEAITNEWNRYSDNKKIIPPTVTTVGPLTTTTWNQGCYYNAQCPVVTSGQCGSAWTGCGATAMAQIMKYWNYPATGVGSHSYSWNSNLLTANFSTGNYNWTNMPNNVTSANADVAKLMYHCGVSLDMNYGSSGSYCGGSWNFVMPQYFGYSTSALNWIKLFQPNDTIYQDRIRAELDSLRPTFYKGSDASVGGHFWVCDGYQNSYPYHFHMNWGWGGAYNGYYYCSALNPATYNFINSQGATINIKPAPVTTGIFNGEESSGISLFPNPAKDNLGISFQNSAMDHVLINIFDMTGREVKSAVMDGNTMNMDLNGISKGIYLLRLQSEQKTFVRKFIIE